MPERDAVDSVAVHLTGLGVPLTLQASGDAVTELVPALRDAWSWCLRDDGRPGEAELRVVLDSSAPPGVDPDGPLVCSDLALLLHELSPRVTVTAIEHHVLAQDLLMFHAAAVADPRTGATVGLVGQSGAGKTTAARALGQAFSYLTDETLGLERDGTVVPYPKPLSLVDPSNPVKRQVSPTDLGLLRPHPRPHLVKMLLLERSPDGPVAPSVEDLGNIEAIMALAPQTSSLSRMHQPLRRMAELLVSTGGLQRVRYREASSLQDVVQVVLERAA